MRKVLTPGTEFIVYFLGTLCVASISLNIILVLSQHKPGFWRDLRKSFKEPPAVTLRDHIRGSSQASVTIIEYSDFQCPYCKQMHTELKRLVSETSDVRWVFRNRLLEDIHPLARQAAVAAECAHEQGQFWNYSDALFSAFPDVHSDSEFEALAHDLQLNPKEFDDCRHAGGPKSLGEQLSASAALDIDMTPTLFINGRRIVGLITYSELIKLVQK